MSVSASIASSSVFWRLRCRKCFIRVRVEIIAFKFTAHQAGFAQANEFAVARGSTTRGDISQNEQSRGLGRIGIDGHRPAGQCDRALRVPFVLLNFVSPVGYVCMYVCMYMCILYVSGSICKVFSAVFEMVTFGRLYNVPNDVIGADADDRSKDELLLASFSRTPRMSLPPEMPHMSLHRMSSNVHMWPQQTVCCPRFDDFTVRTD